MMLRGHSSLLPAKEYNIFLVSSGRAEILSFNYSLTLGWAPVGIRRGFPARSLQVHSPGQIPFDIRLRILSGDNFSILEGNSRCMAGSNFHKQRHGTGLLPKATRKTNALLFASSQCLAMILKWRNKETQERLIHWQQKAGFPDSLLRISLHFTVSPRTEWPGFHHASLITAASVDP